METQNAGIQFRQKLRQELKGRIEQNPNYSLRSFARQLGVSASGLSMIMSGKTPVTLSFIEKVAPKLRIEKNEVHQLQIELINERTQYNTKNFEIIDQEKFELIKEWYHYGILNLMRLKGFQPKAIWIAKRLGISLGEVQNAIERLQAVGLLKIEDGKWTDLSSQFTTHTNNKKFSEAAKQNQIQLFEKATKAITEVEFENRNHTGSTIAISFKDMDKAKEFITKFRKEFMATFDQSAEADEVYHLSVALFPLTQIKTKKTQEIL